MKVSLKLLPETFAVCRLPPNSALPDWPRNSSLFSITRTHEEASILCPASCVPPGTTAESGWRCLRVEGTLSFELSGVLASLLSPLAENHIPIFVISTYDTDYLMIKGDKYEDAVFALEAAGHKVNR